MLVAVAVGLEVFVDVDTAVAVAVRVTVGVDNETRVGVWRISLQAAMAATRNQLNSRRTLLDADGNVRLISCLLILATCKVCCESHNSLLSVP